MGVRGVCVGVWCVWFTNTMNNNHTILKSGDIRYDMRLLSYQLYTCSHEHSCSPGVCPVLCGVFGSIVRDEVMQTYTGSLGSC